MYQVSNDVWISVTAWEYIVLSGQIHGAFHCSLQFLPPNNEVSTFANKCDVSLLFFCFVAWVGVFSTLLGGLFLDRVVLVVYFGFFFIAQREKSLQPVKMRFEIFTLP